jgi:hypothetical protein
LPRRDQACVVGRWRLRRRSCVDTGRDDGGAHRARNADIHAAHRATSRGPRRHGGSCARRGADRRPTISGDTAVATAQRDPRWPERTATPAAVAPKAGANRRYAAMREVAPQSRTEGRRQREPRAKRWRDSVRRLAAAPPPRHGAKRAAASPAGSDVAAAESAAPGVDRSRRTKVQPTWRVRRRQAPAVGGALGATAKPRAEGNPRNELRAEDWRGRSSSCVRRVAMTRRTQSSSGSASASPRSVPAAALPPKQHR